MFSSPFSRRPRTPPHVHVQFMFSSHLRPEAIFLRYPEGQTTNVLFLEILTRATPHASCIHLSRARTSALHPSPSLSRAHSAPSDQTTRTCTSIQTSTVHVSGSLHAVPPRCSTARIHLSRARSPPLLNCTYPSLTRVFSTPRVRCDSTRSVRAGQLREGGVRQSAPSRRPTRPPIVAVKDPK